MAMGGPEASKRSRTCEAPSESFSRRYPNGVCFEKQNVKEEMLSEEDNECCLSGDYPFFDVVLSRNQVSSPFHLLMSTSIVPMLPTARVPVVLRHGGKEWKLSYMGDARRPRFDPTWSSFVSENRLEVGDACVFQLLNNTPFNLTFKVVILRNQAFPSEVYRDGGSFKAPICIDLD